jgi:hypothetical protein
VLARQPLLVSYCSLANEDYVELWWMSRAWIVATPTDGLFEVRVLAKRLYRSPRAFSAAEFPLPPAQWGCGAPRVSGWAVGGVDLAYLYVHTEAFSFRCLGKLLGLECLVELETITVPDAIMGSLLSGRATRHFVPLPSFDSLRTWLHGGYPRVP